MKKVVILIILFIIALVLFGYFAFNQGSGDKSRGGESEKRDTGFRGPTGQPYVNGPTDPPPGSDY